MTDKLLNEEITNQVKEVFDAQLVHPVEILYFSKDDSCETCEETKQLIEEVSAISDKLELKTYRIEDDADIARQHKVELAPSLVITGRDGDQTLDYALRYAGIPSGYEFGSLIQDILMVSKRDSGLSDKTRQELKAIKEPVHLKVFVTPT